MEQFQVTSRPRHLRYVYFVDENYPYETLLSLVHVNQKIWGGRYNPIVPVKDNIITDRWKEILKYYDPDYIFHSKEIDPEVIKQLRIFNPCGYFNLDDQPRREDISGLNGFYFLSQFHAKSRIILTAETWKTESPLLQYYKTNFGFETSLIHQEVELSKDFDRKIVGEKEFGLLNKFIAELRPINQSHLSKRNLNTSILRSKNYIGAYHFEIVIAKDKTSNADLLYYWNRMLFELRSILYVTVEELNLLCADEFFGQVLYDMDWDNSILVTSQSLTKEEVQEIIDNKLRKTKANRRFENGRAESFPFEVQDAHGLFERNYGEVSSVQTLHSRKGLLHFPKLSFTDNVGFYPQGLALDIRINEIGEHSQNVLALPFTTETQYIVKGVKGRINRRRNISVILRNQENTSGTLEIIIPEFKSLLRQLISRPVIDGETKDTKYIDSGLHDDSNKLSAFLKTFNYQFSTIDDFFTDKFWIGIFEGLTKSNKAFGDSILFEEILSKCKPLLAEVKMVELDETGKIKGKKGETYLNEENLELGIKKTLRELCDYRVFLKGFNLKCRHCSSQFWYHINEVKETVNCKGCLEDFPFPVEPKFAYKLNDLIKNSIFRANGLRDGNLTVVRTLVSMRRRSHQSFYYSPQLNLYDSYHRKKPCAEIDIICLSEGQLIIGEAKHTSPGFFEKNSKGENSLDNLIVVAKAIRPDKIILSCYEDLNNKLEKAKKYLDWKFSQYDFAPEIETLPLHTPDYFHLGHHRYFLH
jgi:hypothetical protein